MALQRPAEESSKVSTVSLKWPTILSVVLGMRWVLSLENTVRATLL